MPKPGEQTAEKRQAQEDVREAVEKLLHNHVSLKIPDREYERELVSNLDGLAKMSKRDLINVCLLLRAIKKANDASH